MDATVLHLEILPLEVHHGKAMIPAVQRHVSGMKIAKGSRREAGDHLAAHGRLRVLARLMEVSDQGACLGLEEKSPRGIDRC